MTDSNAIRSHDAVNTSVYHNPRVYALYSGRHSLTPDELVVSLRFHHYWLGRNVLDIGVGAGRTTAQLAPFCRHYQGIDYSPVMVNALRRRKPQIQIDLADMRDLSNFADASFDFIFAPNNVLDAVAHQGRIETLSECHRLLRPAGLLAASSHNLDWIEAGKPPRAEWSSKPIEQLRLLFALTRCWRNYLRLKPRCGLRTGYAIWTDSGHDHGLLHYYISEPAQRAQFLDLGFELLASFDHTGAEVTRNSPTGHTPHLMYVARKQAPLAPSG